MRHPLLPFLCVLSTLALPTLLTGCAGSSFDPLTGTPASPASETGQAFSGKIMGGRQPINGGHLYIFAADTSAYGNASDSLIVSDPTAPYPSTEDSNGDFYITTDAGGGFALASGQYSCTVGQNVYIYSVSGDPGGGTNTASGLMAVLGTCQAGGAFSALTSNNATGNVYMTEVSTVAAAYAMAGFATDATHVASANTSLSKSGLTNAFNNAAQLYNIGTGPNAVALSTTPSNGTVPQELINSLADIIAACINSVGPASPSCSTLFSSALSAGSTGTTPTDTATAMINIAHNPGNAVSTIFNIPTGVVPWGPYLTTAPNDFSIAINYTDSSIAAPAGIAIDASGNAWVTSSSAAKVVNMSPTGSILSGSGYTGGGMITPYGIAIDSSGNAWIADQGGAVVEMTSGGSILSTGAQGYATGNSPNIPTAISIDISGNAWVAQKSTNLLEFDSAGDDLDGGSVDNVSMFNGDAIANDTLGNAIAANFGGTGGSSTFSGLFRSSAGGNLKTGFISTSQKGAEGIGLGASNVVWMSNSTTNSLMKLTPPTGAGITYTLTGTFTGAGMSTPAGLALDGSGHVWLANGNTSISEFSTSGTAVSPSTGYIGTNSTGSSILSGSTNVAVDGSGNVWVANFSGNSVAEFIGAATPVVTPIVSSLVAPYSSPAHTP
jgi:streptogramin lyase